jgi:hypothetical protein
VQVDGFMTSAGCVPNRGNRFGDGQRGPAPVPSTLSKEAPIACTSRAEAATAIRRSEELIRQAVVGVEMQE